MIAIIGVKVNEFKKINIKVAKKVFSSFKKKNY